MTQADIVIRGGTVVDGSGREPYTADVAITGGQISAVGPNLPRGAEEVDATGCLVTPGFVDPHTHYDGQAIWSERLDPSSRHGVTTAIMGNCGVGFAPCRPSDQDTLIRVMEGVEDIPGVVMNAGLDWNWQSFPEYLDAVDARPRDIDVAAYLPHSPLRVFVMGERGVKREPATEEDLAQMRELAREAVAAGAIGFATSRVPIHRTVDGQYIPTYQSDERELTAVAKGMADAGDGVMQMVGNSIEDGWDHDIDMMARITKATGRPFTFSMGVVPDARNHMKKLDDANRDGARLTGQIFPRPMGMILALNLSWNPFSFCPSFAELAALPFEERLERMRDPEVRARLLSEQPDITLPLAQRTREFGRIYFLGDPPRYDQGPEETLAAKAEAAGVSPLELAYDYLLQNDGTAQLLVALGNIVNGSLDTVRELMDDPNLIFGLGDGGAHYGLVCDASYTTHVLSHWVRDRSHGRLPLAQAIATMTRRSAEVMGLHDRGLLAPGYKADVNIIDPQALTLDAPFAIRDLPGGGRRLMQEASGYRATFVSGRMIYRDGQPTGALPGKLVRGSQPVPA